MKKKKHKTFKDRLNNFNDPTIVYEAHLFAVKTSKLVYGALALIMGLLLLYWSYRSESFWVDGTTMVIAALFFWKAYNDLTGWWRIRKTNNIIES